MKEIVEIEQEKEKIYLKKGFFGWKVVYPYKIEGRINWKHLFAGGSWWNLIVVAFIVAMILGAIIEYTHAVELANECLNQSKFIIQIPN